MRGHKVGISSCFYNHSADYEAQRVQIPIQYIHRPKSMELGTTLRAEFIPYSYMDPLATSK